MAALLPITMIATDGMNRCIAGHDSMFPPQYHLEPES